jgi:excisionase family DNA binding protein
MATKGRLLTTQQAADILGTSAHRIRALIKDGRLPYQRYGREYLIDENDPVLVKDRKPGRPPAKKKK